MINIATPEYTLHYFHLFLIFLASTDGADSELYEFMRAYSSDIIFIDE